MNIVNITSDYAVSGALRPEDFERLARMGFRTVINYQPDDEASSLLRPEEARRLAKAEGLAYVHIPAPKHEPLSVNVVGATREALKKLEGPVLGSCASGQRAAIAWAGARARITPVQEVLATLSAAGFEFGFLRDDLRALAGNHRCHEEPRRTRHDTALPQATA